MEVLIQRFHHIASQIFNHLDKKSIRNCRQAAKLWKNFIDDKKLSWIHMVNIPYILENGETYLHMAAQRGQFEVFKMIIEGEEVINTKNKRGITPIHYACAIGHFKIVNTFIQKLLELNIKLNEKLDKSAIHFAIHGGNEKIVEILIENILHSSS